MSQTMNERVRRRSRRMSPAAAAVAEATASQTSDEERLAGILAEARNRIQNQMTPAQIEDPGREDMALARDIVSGLVDEAFRQAVSSGGRFTESADTIVQQILDDIFGFGPLAPYLADEEIEEIIVNGPDCIKVIHARRGREWASARFRSPTDVVNFVNRAAAASGRWLDRSNPQLDARMRDGSRLHALMGPVTVNLPIAVTIRRHRLVARTLDDLVSLGTITPKVREFLQMAVKGRLNLIVAGGTASGKTNMLNALCDAADDDDRFIVVEDTPELQVDKKDVVQLTTREGAEDAKAFTMADLIVESLRMRPDRIITGEARAAEVVDVLMAANTGHDGQMLTVHANSTHDVIQRLETMYLMRGIEVPPVAIRRQIADAFQVILFIRRVFVGRHPKRFVTQIAEMQPSQFMEGEKVVVQNVFEDKGQGITYTGYFPRMLAQRLELHNVHLTPQFFRS